MNSISLWTFTTVIRVWWWKEILPANFSTAAVDECWLGGVGDCKGLYIEKNRSEFFNENGSGRETRGIEHNMLRKKRRIE